MVDGVSAQEYHDQTKHDPDTIGGSELDFENKPRPDKRYVDRPQYGLDGDRPDPTAPTLEAITTTSVTGGELDRDTLIALCYSGAGITKTITRRGEDRAFRAASCTGALYHIDLYPVCGEGTDLDAGVYHYAPRNDTLEQLRNGDYRGVVAEATDNDAVATAPVSMIVTSTWWRNAWKYNARTYRHAFWDSGTVLANVHAAATSFDLPSSTVLGFADDPLVDLLGLDPTWEAPLEVLAIGNDTTTPAPTTIDPIEPRVEPWDSDPVEYPLIHRAWAQSTLPDGATARTWRRQGPRPIDGRRPGDGDRIPLDPVDEATASARPVANTVHRRGSCREYTKDQVSFRKFSTILDRAIRGTPLDVRSGTEPLEFVDCYCIVHAVEGLDSGVYQYHPGTGAVEQLRTGVQRDDTQYLALGQQLAGDAAANIYFLTDLDAVTDALGDRGYRVAQLEAALTAGRLYLATYAHRDLGGTGLTFFDDEVTQFLEPRATGQTPMFLYTLGHPA